MAHARLQQPSNISFRFVSKKEASDEIKVRALAHETATMINRAWAEKNEAKRGEQGQAYRKTGVDRTSANRMAERIQKWDEYRLCLAIDTEKNNKIIGIACIQRHENQVSHKGEKTTSAEFFLFSLLPEYCGGNRNISKNLLEFAISEAEKEFKATEVYLSVIASVPNLVKFYLNRGFTLTPYPDDLKLEHIVKSEDLANPQGEKFLHLSRSLPEKKLAVKASEKLRSMTASSSPEIITLQKKLDEIEKKYQAKGLEPQLSITDLLTLLNLRCFTSPQTEQLSLLKITLELEIEAAQLTAYYLSYAKPIKYLDVLFPRTIALPLITYHPESDQKTSSCSYLQK